MKDSGVEWIGEIPEDWEIVKLKVSLDRKKELVSNYNGQDILSLTMQGVIKRDLVNPTGKMPSSFEGYQIIEKNSLIACLFDIDVTPRCIGISSFEGLTSPAYTQFQIKKGFYLKYVYYYLLFLDNDKILVPLTKSLRNTITSTDFLNLPIPFVAYENQKLISSFLDDKLQRINSIISDTQQSIIELKKYKQSLITETVTKGLDKTVEMKDSGIEVLGKINKDFRIISLGYLGDFQNGISKSGDSFGKGYPFVSYSDVYKNRVLPKKTTNLVQSTIEEQKNYSVRKNDIFFTRTSEIIEEIGMSSACYETIEQATFSGFVIRFRPNVNIFLVKFLRYFLEGSFVREYFSKEMNIVTRASLGQGLLKKLPIVLPSLEEQQQIVEFLDNKTSKIDSLISDKEKMIKEYESYKKSLIYEYVTGKKQV